MNHVEAVVLQFVAHLHPDVFGDLDDFATGHRDVVDPVVADFNREVQFYLAWMAYEDYLGRHDLTFCLPDVVTRKAAYAEQAFDLALADKLVHDERPIVGNDVDLHGAERILVVSGPNQGGKTTYARMFGQLHHLARLGCPVPARRARLAMGRADSPSTYPSVTAAPRPLTCSSAGGAAETEQRSWMPAAG